MTKLTTPNMKMKPLRIRITMAPTITFGAVNPSAAIIPINDPSFETSALACSAGGGCFGRQSTHTYYPQHCRPRVPSAVKDPRRLDRATLRKKQTAIRYALPQVAAEFME
jgi:hypothetical protein